MNKGHYLARSSYEEAFVVGPAYSMQGLVHPSAGTRCLRRHGHDSFTLKTDGPTATLLIPSRLRCVELAASQCDGEPRAQELDAGPWGQCVSIALSV